MMIIETIIFQSEAYEIDLCQVRYDTLEIDIYHTIVRLALL